MKRVLFAVLMSVALPGAALAQRPVPVPPMPPVPPAPMVAPVPPMPPMPAVVPVPPVPPVPPTPFALDHFNDWEFNFHNDLNLDLNFDLNLEHLKAEIATMTAKMGADARFFYEQGPVIDLRARTSSGDGDYQSGMSQLQQRRYEQAIATFAKVIARKAERTDAALYWKAWAEFKGLAQSDNALASLATLRKEYASSRYLADAKVLEADVKRMAGRPAAPASADDDEIKLLAIQGLSKTGEALPLLENVLQASNSLGVKRRALYVLALSNDPKANDVLMRYAKGSGNPDLQIEAIRYLGERSTTLTADQLREIYSSVDDTRVKLAVIDAYRAKSDKPALIKLAADRALKDDIRPHLLSRLGGLATADDVMALYKQETDPIIRAQILSSLGNTLTPDQLATIARTDADTKVRQRAINSLGGKRNEETSKALVGLYQVQTDRDVRRSVINTLSGQRNAEALVALAKQETDIELKRDLVRRLSDMAGSSKAAADYLMEQLR